MGDKFKIKVPLEVIHSIAIRDPKANDRRKAANLLTDDWFNTHQLKLGRDYTVWFSQQPMEDDIWGSRRGWYATFNIKDPKLAVLFKLACI